MNIHKTNIAIERATSLVNILIESGDETERKDIDNTLFDINRNIVGSRYSDAVFSDDDESEDCLMFRTLTDFAYEARHLLKTAKDQLLK